MSKASASASDHPGTQADSGAWPEGWTGTFATAVIWPSNTDFRFLSWASFWWGQLEAVAAG